MSSKIQQLFESAPHSIDSEGNWLSASVVYIVDDVQNEAEALSFALQNIPHDLYYTDGKDPLHLNNIEINERKTSTAWSVNANYNQPEQSQYVIGGTAETDSESTMSFDCGTGAKHVTHAYTETRYPATAPTADFAVNWNGKYGQDMQISGVDVPTSQLRETYTKSIPLSKLTTNYKRTVQLLTGRVNNESFKGWERGEVQFLGCSFTAPSRNAKKVIVTYHFAIQLNENNVEVAGQTISKKGFEYAWALTDSTVNNGVVQASTKGVYVNEVCQYGDFALLGV